ncbi:hypothetical protein PENSPDRAFT_636331 [Peniophora sp. CONT]|nr:hypothetical protein PENSPDRAFT_636331 [Peniophora sp. CONT]
MSSRSSPSAFQASSPPLSSTVPSSPPAEESDGDSEEEEPKLVTPIDQIDETERTRRLDFLLAKSEVYAKVLGEFINSPKYAQEADAPPKPTPKARGRKSAGRGRSKGKARAGTKRPRADDEDEDEDATETTREAKRVKNDGSPVFVQPELLTGATLKDYQLEGVQWMIGLYESGVSGILADEMGLGKTIQTIAFLAYLRCKAARPTLIVSPLSVLHNWQVEFERFAPDIPTCVYHGTPSERKALQEDVLSVPADHSYETQAAGGADATGQLTTFPVVLTTYEMVIKDRAFLARHKWGYVVVDEGHRLKNMDSMLMREIKKYESASRLILTGTPLQNNLSELWSLLNFILPDIFDDVSAFQDWFNLPTLAESLSSEKSSNVIRTLHGILKPFLLRRLKVDVMSSLPPKKEYVLYAPLSQQQRELYDAIAKGTIRGHLTGNQPAAEADATAPEEKTPRKTRSKRRTLVDYNVDGSDKEYFERLERGDIKSVQEQWAEQEHAHKTHEQLGAEHAFKAKLKKINNLHLQNSVMQLRKVCSHPFLFDWPVDTQTMQPVLNDELINASGKMMVLERLLDELFARGHKVLVFSQFKTMLDVIEDWATEYKQWPLCRIDGSTSALDRRKEMERFQTGGDAPDAPCLFLLSTRSGGLGINLTAADTVVFYDQDWNPQMDLQAQDRAHRIGQTKPVLVFRLVTKHTIESKIMQRAGQKRQLEALVIAKGKFKMPLKANGKTESMAELAGSLLELEGEKIEVVPATQAGRKSVLSDSALDALLDRSPEVFTRRGAGWRETDLKKDTRKARTAREGTEEAGAFEVYEAPVDEGNDALGRMMGEEDLGL